MCVCLVNLRNEFVSDGIGLDYGLPLFICFISDSLDIIEVSDSFTAFVPKYFAVKLYSVLLSNFRIRMLLLPVNDNYEVGCYCTAGDCCLIRQNLQCSL